ncbi:hypothetical protein BBK82_30300 [Lentzea guizhouensis]|uniref:Bacterial transcriptional activator domain-containing protein n=1 Tax=Lentzea guizhouensis TaxID=1586287 RepID=A0A1B2HPQ8_9PSEU|nr:BTAD domain-containing putative transcriptional regulator [Lentzea guizhouensis]ANZ39700.1 hypothetical protein BBK82_30300 [Lentzea guizhouensis]
MLFRVLGPLEVVHLDGRKADVPAGAPEHVLLALSLRPNAWVSADSLAEAVWPDRTSTCPAEELWPYVHDLCRRTPLFGETSARIEGMGGRYRLNIGEGELDSVVFEQLVHEGRALLPTDPESAARCFRAAADLWRGAPFALLNTYHSRAEADRLTRLRWAALDHLVDALMAMDQTAGSVTLLQALTAEDPKRQRTWVRLVDVLTHAGRPLEAAAASRKAAREVGAPMPWDAR